MPTHTHDIISPLSSASASTSKSTSTSTSPPKGLRIHFVPAEQPASDADGLDTVPELNGVQYTSTPTASLTGGKGSAGGKDCIGEEGDGGVKRSATAPTFRRRRHGFSLPDWEGSGVRLSHSLSLKRAKLEGKGEVGVHDGAVCTGAQLVTARVESESRAGGRPRARAGTGCTVLSCASTASTESGSVGSGSGSWMSNGTAAAAARQERNPVSARTTWMRRQCTAQEQTPRQSLAAHFHLSEAQFIGERPDLDSELRFINTTSRSNSRSRRFTGARRGDRSRSESRVRQLRERVRALVGAVFGHLDGLSRDGIVLEGDNESDEVEEEERESEEEEERHTATPVRLLRVGEARMIID